MSCGRTGRIFLLPPRESRSSIPKTRKTTYIIITSEAQKSIVGHWYRECTQKKIAEKLLIFCFLHCIQNEQLKSKFAMQKKEKGKEY